ncbi:MAG: carboxypeptidase-like regulatory domain-containing protein [Candidatus Acidiferrum sp.]
MILARRSVLICLTLLLFAAAGAAQDKKDKEPQLRTLHGVVTDKSENPIAGSVVFLKNLRTNAVTSRFTDSDGTYRFSGLDPNADYEVHAEFEGSKSNARTLSSFDNRKDMILDLKIDRKKS